MNNTEQSIKINTLEYRRKVEEASETVNKLRVAYLIYLGVNVTQREYSKGKQ